MLKLQSTEPVVVDLGGGASVTLEAPSPRIVAAGRQAARRGHNDDADLAGDIAALLFTEGVLRASIREWEGVGDADGKALPCTPENIVTALTDPFVFDTLERGYVIPIIRREAEKNASAVSSAGTSAGVTAGKATAGSRAGSPRKPRAKKAKTN